MYDDKRDAVPVNPAVLSFEQANVGRDQQSFQRNLDAADLAKAQALIPFMAVPEGGAIKDIGSGTGRVTEILARHFSRTHVYGLDLSHELLEVAELGRMLMYPLYGNACEQHFPDNSLDAAYSSTCMHEILSFQGLEGLRSVLEVTFRELKNNGVLVIRDMVIPDSTEPVYMLLASDDGRQPASSDKETLSEVERLSSLELFRRFHRDFAGGSAFDYSIETIGGQDYIKLAPEWAYEFYMRKDYRRNYSNEIHEKYGPWTAKQANEMLLEAGFSDIELHVEHNAWILENRLLGKVSLHRRNSSGVLQEVEFPPTHLTIVARKRDPLAEPSSVEGISLFEAMSAIQDVHIDSAQGVLLVGEQQFDIDPHRMFQGTKRSVFYRQNPAGTVLKIPRVDSKNPHNAFKAMFQTVERQHILTEYGVPHLEVIDFDRSGPPYRYLEQKQLPENASCVADLILSGELSEVDVQQMAEIVNHFELERRWQLDTNPYNWFRVTESSGVSQLVYADGKVYPYDEKWTFTRKGLLQWLLPALLPGKSDSVENHCAEIPREVLSNNVALWWNPEQLMVSWWRKYLHPDLIAALEE